MELLTSVNLLSDPLDGIYGSKYLHKLRYLRKLLAQDFHGVYYTLIIFLAGFLVKLVCNAAAANYIFILFFVGGGSCCLFGIDVFNACFLN